MCIQAVIFKMFSSLQARLITINDIEYEASSKKERSAWVETAVVVLNGVSGLLSTYLHTFCGHSSFGSLWQKLLEHFTTLLENKNLEISTAVFKALCHILSEVNTEADTSAEIDVTLIDEVWELWSRGLPLAISEYSVTAENNQACLVAYVSALHEIYRLIRGKVSVQQIQRMLDILRDTIQQADTETYSADVEYLTSLQSQVLDFFKGIRTDIIGVTSALIMHASDLIALSFRTKQLPAKGRPTYVALSKASMLLLGSLVTTHASEIHIYSSGAVSKALEALSEPITLKYAFTITTKSLTPWQQATSTSVAIIDAILPVIANGDVPTDEIRNIWRYVIIIANGIASASVPLNLPRGTILSDQTFDIDSFLTLRSLIIPALGNPLIPDRIRRSYTESLFQNSIIHAPEPWDLPHTGTELFACLSSPGKGRTVDSAPSLRTKMSYLCLATLFSLTSSTSPESDPARTKLSQAAAPYLVVRAGLTFKAYNADQPLRGMMPQPLSQRKELLWLLKELVELRCEQDAIPETPHVKTDARRHLHRLFPLLAKMVRTAAKDEEVLEWVGRALDAVGEEFGI